VGVVSELTAFRDYARERAEWQPGAMRAACLDRTVLGTPKPADHANCGGYQCGCRCHEPKPADRALFARLADEIDAYLSSEAGDDEPLFGGDS